MSVNAAKLIALAERVEAATGATDLELNGDVWWLVKRQRAENEYWRAAMGLPRPLGDKMPEGLGAHAVRIGAPNYSASLDAVLLLAAEKLPELFWDLARVPPSSFAPYCGHVFTWDGERLHTHEGNGRTPALALLAAFLRVLATQATEVDRGR